MLPDAKAEEVLFAWIKDEAVGMSATAVTEGLEPRLDSV